MSEAEAFESSLRDNPDDLAGWCAYADYLTEHGNPLGEFMQVQIALEDENRSKDERTALKKQERRLLAANEGAWLGKQLVRYLDPEKDEGDPQPDVSYRWHRGFITELNVQCMTINLGRAIASCPAARMLRELRIRTGEHYYGFSSDAKEARVPTPQGFSEHHGYFELLGSSCLESLRVFRTGDNSDEPPEEGWVMSCNSHLDGLEQLLISMPRVEELHLLSNDYDLETFVASPNPTRLRVLRAHHLGARRGENEQYEYPLDVLAANPAFSNLTHLQFHPHYAPEGYGSDGRSFIPLDRVLAVIRSPHLKKLTHLQLRLSDMGDAGVREIIASGILKQLKWLDLQHGCVSDEGARALAVCADAQKLDRIDLSYNGVTPAGLAALRAAKINAVANNPLTRTQLDEREYLRHGDYE